MIVQLNEWHKWELNPGLCGSKAYVPAQLEMSGEGAWKCKVTGKENKKLQERLE
jgi:hypothetical protein